MGLDATKGASQAPQQTDNSQTKTENKPSESFYQMVRPFNSEDKSWFTYITKIALAIISVPTALLMDALVGVCNWILPDESKKSEETKAEEKKPEQTTINRGVEHVKAHPYISTGVGLSLVGVFYQYLLPLVW